MSMKITRGAQAAHKADPQPGRQRLVDRPDGLPAGYELDSDGLWLVTPDGSETHIGSRLVVTAQFKEATGQGWGKVIEIVDPDGRRHTFTFLNGDIATRWPLVLSRLLSSGYQLGDADQAGARLKRLIQNWHPNARKSKVERIGVHLLPKPCFLLASGKVIGAQDVIADPAATSASADMTEAGSLEDWREHIGKLCSGNPLMILGVSLAFFGPVLGLIDPDMAGGFHLGGASSRGKSSIAEASGSVWGGPHQFAA